MVLLPAVSKPDGSLTAVVVSGGKQYRVSPGDQILVDRLAAEPGSSVKFGRVLLVHDGEDFKIGSPALDVQVEAKVLAHTRGPRIEVLRYKSKKHVRVHRGGRADLTAVEILTVGGKGVETSAAPKGKPVKGKTKARAESRQPETKVEPAAETKARASAKPKASATRKGAKESE